MITISPITFQKVKNGDIVCQSRFPYLPFIVGKGQTNLTLWQKRLNARRVFTENEFDEAKYHLNIPDIPTSIEEDLLQETKRMLKTY
jgi:hypothetical protein